MTQELETKVKQALKLLQSCSRSAGKPLEIAYSGGKDSDVILELAKMAGISYRAIYKNTTIDPPGTIKHVKENGVEIRRPAKNFFQLMAEHGYPNKNYRFCCNILKENVRRLPSHHASENINHSRTISLHVRIWGRRLFTAVSLLHVRKELFKEKL